MALDFEPWPDTDDATEATLDADNEPGRHIHITAASFIRPRRVKWVWKERIASGTLALLAGPEGLGKSTFWAWIAARATRGDLPGEHLGQARSVLVCAAEDSWEHTIVPRLMAAGADLERVYRVEVRSDDTIVGLSLPRDLIALEETAADTGASLLILDPLLSRISDNLDTHKDSEVRRALEPLTALADRAGLAIVGVIHHNKSGSSDPLQLVMASKAFTAVARSVHTVIADPDDESGKRRLFGTPKNNIGRGDLATLSFTINGHPIETEDGTAWTGQLDWTGEVDGTIAEAMRRASADPDDRSATVEAGDWLLDYLHDQGSTAPSADIKKHGAAAGHSQDALKRARRRRGITTESAGFPRITFWSLPGTQPEHAPTVENTATAANHPSGSTSGSTSGSNLPRGDTPTALTALTGCSDAQSVQSVQSEQGTGAPAPTVCTVCGSKLNDALAAAGETTHATCDPTGSSTGRKTS